MIQLNIVCLTTILLALFKSSQSYMVTVDARGKECFREKVEIGTKMGKYIEFIRQVGIVLKFSIH